MQTPYIDTSFVPSSSRGAGAAAAGGRPRFDEGETIGDRFLVRHCLRGGMGEVYLAYDHEWNRPVAIKTFQSEHATHPRIHALLRGEVSHWVALGKHANVVQCFGMEVIDALPFILMEWVVGEAGRGTSLRDRLEQGPLPVRDALQFAIDVCRGLLHAQGMLPGFVHRDVKAENVLVTGARVARVADLGLATLKQDLLGTTARPISMLDIDLAERRAGRLKEAGRKSSSMPGFWTQGFAIFAHDEMGVELGVGTPGYRSPEQVSGRDLDERSDVFSLACTLYEMLAGHTPAAVVGAEHVDAGNRSLAAGALPPAVPQSLRETLWACLEARPEDRPSVDGLLVRLCRIYEGEHGTPPRPETTAEAELFEVGARTVCLAQLGLNDLALAECGRALELQPHNPSLHNVRGALLDRMSRTEEAIAAFSSAMALDAGYAGTYVNRGLVYARTERLDDALADYDHAIRLDPACAEAYLNRADVHRLRGSGDAALADLNRAIELRPRMVAAYLARAAFFFLSGRYDEALADYERAGSLDPGSTAAMIGRGNVFYARGEHARATDEFDRAIEADPSCALAYRNIAALLREQGKPDRALWYIEKAAELGDEDAKRFKPRAHLDLAAHHRSEARFEQAIEEYTNAIALVPHEAALWFNRALVYRDVGRLDEALRDFSEGIRLNPRTPRAYADRAVIYSRLGREREALADFDRAIALAPADSSNYVNRGNAHLRAGRGAEALADYERAVREDPGLAAAWNSMGVVHANRGEYRRAHELFARAAQLGNPSAAWNARQAARDAGLPEPPPLAYPVEAVWDRFTSVETVDELRQAARECPAILSSAFISSVEGMAGDSSDPEIRRILRVRLSLMYDLRREARAAGS
ncbi:MAG TPA: tetratricopeptide repeat protein [Longimicrobium sp.]|nr:tetratricopeptide repeat protein [Longimicrobium sp.]